MKTLIFIIVILFALSSFGTAKAPKLIEIQRNDGAVSQSNKIVKNSQNLKKAELVSKTLSNSNEGKLKISAVDCSLDVNSEQVNGQCRCKDGMIGTYPYCVSDCSYGNGRLNYKKTKCICASGFTGVYPYCVKICDNIINSEPSLDGTQCVCKENYQFNENNTKCVQVCGGKVGYTLVNYDCLIDCTDICNSMPNHDNTKCICNPFYFNSSGTCRKNCTAQGRNKQLNFNQTICVCKPGYIQLTQNYGECLIDCSKDVHSFPDETKSKCICKEGYIGKYPNCKQIVVNCQNDSNSETNNIGTECVCKKGSNGAFPNCQNISILCQQSIYSQLNDANQCVCKQGFSGEYPNCLNCSNFGQILNESGNQCVCKQGLARNAQGKCEFQCGREDVKVLGKCHPYCSKNYCHASTRSCQCKSSYRNFSSYCVPECYLSDLNSTYPTYYSNQCICKLGFANISGTCVLSCNPSFSEPTDNYDGCVCKKEFIGIYPNCTRDCTHLPNSVESQSKTQCVCAEGYQFNQNKTACVQTSCQIPQKIKVNGICIIDCSSDQNSIPNHLGDKCVCKPNYFNNTGKCLQNISNPNNPSNCSSINHTQLDPHSTKCICKQGFVNSSGICALNCSHICHSYPSPSGETCVCADKYYMNDQGTQCLLNCSNTLYSQPDHSNSKCVCIQGFIQVNDCCIKDCSNLLHSHPDKSGSKCQCNSGYVYCHQTKKCESK